MFRQAVSGKPLCPVLIWASCIVILATTAFTEVQRFTEGNGATIIKNQKLQTTERPSREVDTPTPRERPPQSAPSIVTSSFPVSETPNWPSVATAAAICGLQGLKASGSEGGILRYRTDQGILHITNVPLKAADLASQWEQGLAFERCPHGAEVPLASARYASPLDQQPPRAKSTQGPPIANFNRAASSDNSTQEASSGNCTREKPGANSQILVRREKDGARLSLIWFPAETGGMRSLRFLKPILTEASWHYGLPLPRIVALFKVESNFKPVAVSPKGAMGGYATYAWNRIRIGNTRSILSPGKCSSRLPAVSLSSRLFQPIPAVSTGHSQLRLSARGERRLSGSWDQGNPGVCH